MASITSLPNELILFVLENLNSDRDTASLCRVNRKLHDAVTPVLYKNAVDRHDMWPLAFAAFSRNEGTMSKMLAAGADAKWVFDDRNMPIQVRRLLTTQATADVQHPKNARFGITLATRYHGQSHRRRRDAHLYMGVNDLDEDDFGDDGLDEDGLDDDGFDDAGFGAIAPLAWPDVSVDLNDHFSDHDPDDEEDDPSEYVWSESSLSSTDSSTLGSDDRPRNGADRDHDSHEAVFFTALHLAAAMGHDAIVRILLDHGALLHAGSKRFCCCKRAAGMLNNVESPEQESPWTLPCWSPLHMAICYNHPNTAKLLLSRGANCMMEVEESHNIPYQITALHQAAAFGQKDLVKYLVDNGHQTKIDVRDTRTLTPFYYAYANDRWDSTIPLLLQMGANINVDIRFYQPYCTITPLGEAVRLGNFDDAQKLLDLGADHSRGFISTATGHRAGLPPLHLGCMPSARLNRAPGSFDGAVEAAGRVKIMEAFIAKGSDIHGTDCYGDTPLISAAQNRVLPSVRALIAAGADVHASNSLGRTVIMQAVLGPASREGNSSVDRNPPLSTPETMRILTSILSELVTAGARINDVDQFGNNVLHLLMNNSVAKLNNFVGDMAQVLLTYPGADVLLTTRNKIGQLAFEAAFQAEVEQPPYQYQGLCDMLLRPGWVQGALKAEDVQRMCRFAMQNEGHAINTLVCLLLDLDVQGKLLSVPSVFEKAVKNNMWSLVARLARRGIPPLDQETCTELLLEAAEAGQWDLAYQLVEMGADVNRIAADGDGPWSPLQEALRDYDGDNHDPLADRLIEILVDKGADIHYTPDGTSHRGLTSAIRVVHPKMVRHMLRQNQLLCDDPRAVGGCYLHEALRFEDPFYYSPQYPHPRIVLDLLHAGADVTELDDNGDYPLTVLLKGLCTHAMVHLQEPRYALYCDLIKDLVVPGLQITKPNKQGRSIVDYLEELMQTKPGQLWVAPKVEVVEHASGAKVLKFKPARPTRMAEGRPLTTIWDVRGG